MPLPAMIAVDELFQPPAQVSVSISPDGTRIAFLAPWKNRLNVWVQSLVPGTDDYVDARCVTACETCSVREFRWTEDPRRLLYLQEDGPDDDRHVHVHRIDVDEPEAPGVDLTPLPGFQVVAFNLPADRPGTAILQVGRSRTDDIDLYELDIATGGLAPLARNPGHVHGWLYNGHGDPIAITLADEGDIALSRFDRGSGALHPIITFDGADHPTSVAPLELTPDGTGVWAGSNRGTDRTRLVRIDVFTGDETDVDSHPSLDLDGARRAAVGLPSPLIHNRRTGELIGARYLGERQVVHALDPHFAAVLEALEALSDGDLGELSSDESGQRWVASFVHDRDPGVTWYYDHSSGETRLLFRPHPHLDPDVLAPMSAVTVPARDGLRLPSYLTLPVGVEPAGLPMVLLVHGDPWRRDAWGYDPLVQLLANRGYAVLQVHFRGSVGFGKAHTKAAIGEVAGRVHDDLVDAVGWAVEQGYAAPDRVGVVGGHAALFGVTAAPDLFAAAITRDGIPDLTDFVRSRPPLAASWRRYVGDPDDPEQEADMLARSPISRVDAIRTPLMVVVRAAADVPAVQAGYDDLVAALRARGADVEYVVEDDAGRGVDDLDQQAAIHRTAERFLARHLGGRSERG